MKNYIIICFLLYGFFSHAQTDLEEQVVGVYQIRQGPDDFRMFIIFPDHRYVLGYFGGMQKGTWNIEGEALILTQSPEPAFALYGRKRASFKDKTSIRYNVEASNRVLVNWKSSNAHNYYAVFNENANCFSFPYIQKLDRNIENIYVTSLGNLYNDEISQEVKIFHFKNPKKYNELLLVNLSSQYTTSNQLRALFKNDKLYFGPNDEGIPKKPIEDLSQDDEAFINQYSKTSLFKDELNRGEELFPYIENPTLEELEVFHRIYVHEKLIMEAPKATEAPLFIAKCENN